MTKFQKTVLDYVACELSMISESDRAVDAGSEFEGDFRKRAGALEKIIVIAFSDEFKNEDYDMCDDVGTMINSLSE